MSFLVRGLDRIGRQATLWLALGIFAGVLLPPLATLARPLLTPAMFVLIVVTVLRLEPAAVRQSLAKPIRLGAGVAWILVGAPLLVLPLARVLGDGFFADHAILLAASAPVISGAAYALILGLDAAYALALGVVATALVPLTLPLVAGIVLGVDLAIDPVELALRLAVLIGGGAVAGIAARLSLGAERLERRAQRIDGIAVLAMLVFGAAAMDGVTRTALASPGFTLAATALVFAVAIGLNAAGTIVFRHLGWRLAMTIGLMTGFKNLGVVVAALGPAADDRTVVFLGIVQLPIYLMPALLRLVITRRRARSEPRR